jgi:hypothetical protein
MSSEDTSGNHLADEDAGKDEASNHNNDELASKLSKELSNWRRKRTSSRPRIADMGGGSKVQSEPARTIKVRGHETLVIRKSRPLPKPGTEADSQ